MKKKSFKKFRNFEKKCVMLKVDPKTDNLSTLQNFDVIEKKMDAGFGISHPPEINKG